MYGVTSANIAWKLGKGGAICGLWFSGQVKKPHGEDCQTIYLDFFYFAARCQTGEHVWFGWSDSDPLAHFFRRFQHTVRDYACSQAPT